MGLLGNEGGLTGLEIVLQTKADVFFLRGGQFESQSRHQTEMNWVLRVFFLSGGQFESRSRHPTEMNWVLCVFFLHGGQFESQSRHRTEMNWVLSDIP